MIKFPFMAKDHIQVHIYNDMVLLNNKFNGNYRILKKEIYEYIVTGNIEDSDGMGEYLAHTIDNLIAEKFIMPDLTKITLGIASIYVQQVIPIITNEIDIKEFYNTWKNGQLTSSFNAELIKAEDNLHPYEYLCERNTLRQLLIGYGIEHPLLWMSCGLFIHDNDFQIDGIFSTSFSRAMIDPKVIPILGDYKKGLDWDIIDAHIENGFPVIIMVDVFYMPYKVSTYYQKRHGSHSIFIIGKRDDNYLIMDWYHPDYFVGEISKTDLTLARTSKNEKDQMSVFNGHPIEALYRLTYMQRHSLDINLSQYIKKNLFNSLKFILGDSGIICLLNKAKEEPPLWLNAPVHEGYSNAIQSFFFLALELKILLLYYKQMSDADEYKIFNPNKLYEDVTELKTSVDVLQSKILLAYRRKKVVDVVTWNDLLNNVIDKCMWDYSINIVCSMKLP